MAKKKSSAALSHGETVAGLIFLALYLFVLPLVKAPAFRLAETLLGMELSGSLENAVYYYLLFAVTVVIFHGFLCRTSGRLLDNLGQACQTVGVGLVALYGLNELFFRLSAAWLHNRVNLNDSVISAQIRSAPWSTFLIVVLLAPFIEEVLFRGLVFGGLKGRSRAVAYAVSCLLFAFLHVWQFAAVHQDLTYFLLMLQYLVPGLVLAWCYDRSGTLWASIAVHVLANLLSAVTIL